jgi:hypothetical protein
MDLMKNSRKKDHSEIMLELVQLVHFSPCKPENMNVYAERMSNTATVYDGSRWWGGHRVMQVGRHVAVQIAGILKDRLQKLPLPTDAKWYPLDEQDVKWMESFLENECLDKTKNDEMRSVKRLRKQFTSKAGGSPITTKR